MTGITTNEDDEFDYGFQPPLRFSPLKRIAGTAREEAGEDGQHDSPPPPPFRFFDAPKEIRDYIYELCKERFRLLRNRDVVVVHTLKPTPRLVSRQFKDEYDQAASRRGQGVEIARLLGSHLTNPTIQLPMPLQQSIDTVYLTYFSDGDSITCRPWHCPCAEGIGLAMSWTVTMIKQHPEFREVHVTLDVGFPREHMGLAHPVDCHHGLLQPALDRFIEIDGLTSLQVRKMLAAAWWNLERVLWVSWDRGHGWYAPEAEEATEEISAEQ
ncbi:uncharacterized protein LTR77_003814 [Saxophila tyrrhenica]|uniref:Uncharacterized protein n=1 Tax=Saxophila tyrrhenica TaxID=1690608 RepID=A0AAV9PEW8_9PEZI|nr:hypothetical protein LTR77_003814 [Saxophila tyrrhenica]